MINLTINGKEISAPENSTVIEAARLNNIHIPSLCYLRGKHQFGACRICVVEVVLGNGRPMRNLQAACMMTISEGMIVKTNTERVRKARKVLYELLVSDHSTDCLTCVRNQNCELQQLGKELGVTETRFAGEHLTPPVEKGISITRDMSKCVLCRRCVTACNSVQGIGAINAQNRGFDTVISPAMELPLSDVACVNCGQCTVVCPVGALTATDSTKEVWNAINDPDKRVIVQPAPAVRVALGEMFGLPAGTDVTGKMSAALHNMGFDDVFDTNFGADLTIMEEGTEFLQRAKAAVTGGDTVIPMITSCSPGWIKYIEHNYPDLLGHLSTCKSPHEMLGAIAKSYYAEKLGIDPKNIVVVSVMPCTAKKFEAQRPELSNDGCQNIDYVITTRELGDMIKSAGINFNELEDVPFDNPLGFSTGAADIFGLTGGVMEAALRTVYELTTGRELPFENLHVSPIVGLDQIKDASIKFENVLPEYSFLEGFEVNIAVTSGAKGAKQLLEQIENGSSKYHFIEVMGCPGGCITGGGQPRTDDPDVREKRMKGLYAVDEGKALRKSHENEYIKKLYADFLGEPCGHKSHELLHTTYTERGLYNECLKK